MPRSLAAIFAAAVLVACPYQSVAQLSEIEQAMVAFIDATNAGAEAELIESVNINSGSMNLPV